jgi:hypothetical protein
MSEQLPPVPAPAPAPMPAPAPAGVPVSAPAGDKRGLAIASLVLGILSLCGSGFLVCGGLLSVIGIVLGALGINSRSKNMAIAGIVLSAVGLLLTIIFRIVFRGILFNDYWQQLLHSIGM